MTDSSMSTGRVWRALLGRWWVILLAAIVGAGIMFAVSAAQRPTYDSTASVYFSMRTATSGSDINQGSTYTQNQMLSFAQLATSSIVLDEVRDDVGEYTDTQLRSMISVSIPQNTVLLDVTAVTGDPDESARIANSVANNLAAVVSDVAPREVVVNPDSGAQTDEGTSTIIARVVDPAVPAVFQSSPNKSRDAVLGFVAGGLLAGLIVAIWALLDRRIRSKGAMEQVTDLPLLTTVPRRRDAWRQPVLAADPNGPGAEAYRQLRTSLQFAAVGHELRSVAITSSNAGEGKTTVSVNLALSYVEAGLDVVIVDADLRRPQVADALGLENAVGLTSVLVGSVDWQTAQQQWGDTTLRVLTAGEVPPNPAEMLASKRMRAVLGELVESCDVLIVDTAPLLSVADATVLSTLVDTTVVVASPKSRAEQLQASLDALANSHAHVAGVVLTHVGRPVSEEDAYISTTQPQLAD